MKYILIETRDGDQFTQEFSTADDAIKVGEFDFSRLTDHDKKHHSEFYVLESVNPDEDAIDHLDGAIVKQWI